MFNIAHMVDPTRGASWVQEDESVTEPVGLPAYKQVAGDLRRQIAAGELPVGVAIPSTAELTRRYEISSTVARAAVAQLRADGLVVGQPGKGVFVRATPEAVAHQVVTVEELGRRTVELRELYESEVERREALEGEVARLHDEVAGLRARVEDSSR